MKLGAVTTAWRDEETIRGTMECLTPFVDRHIVMISETPFNGKNIKPDKTEEIARSFKNAEVFKGVWEEHVMRNIGIELCKDCDWMIGFDADEMITCEDMEKLIDVLGKTNYDALGFISKVYWKSMDYIFVPDPDHVKVCLIRPSGRVRYVEKQCVNGAYDVLDYKYPPYITHHHLSWCEPKNILRKVIHYNHADEFDGEKWYNEHFKDWKLGDPVIQPFGTTWSVKRNPLPEELRRLL